MSDFDKEAEREKLREKYERDKAEREATQRMSDLLLKGATMTNTHCGTCGDPLFQMDGTTFCPSCHGSPDAVEGTDLEVRPAEESPGDAADAAGDTGADRAATAETDRPDETDAGTNSSAGADRPDADASPDDARTQRFDPDAVTEPDESTVPASNPGNPDRDGESTAARGDATGRDASSRSGREPSPSSRSVPTGGSPDGDLGAARDSLVAALEKFAAEAAETDDPRYATECLEAAREAGEALDALR